MPGLICGAICKQEFVDGQFLKALAIRSEILGAISIRSFVQSIAAGPCVPDLFSLLIYDNKCQTDLITLLINKKNVANFPFSFLSAIFDFKMAAVKFLCSLLSKSVDGLF